MTLVHALHDLTTLVYLASNCTIAYFAFPAYKRKRTWGLLLLSCASVNEVFVIVVDRWTPELHLSTQAAYTLYCLSRVANIFVGVAFAVGMILLIRTVAPEEPQATLKSLLRQKIAEGEPKE